MKIWKLPGNVRDGSFGPHTPQDSMIRPTCSSATPMLRPLSSLPEVTAIRAMFQVAVWRKGANKKRAKGAAIFQGRFLEATRQYFCHWAEFSHTSPQGRLGYEVFTLGGHVPRNILLLWKKCNMNTGRKTSVSAMGWEGDGWGREPGQNPHVFLLDPKTLY